MEIPRGCGILLREGTPPVHPLHLASLQQILETPLMTKYAAIPSVSLAQGLLAPVAGLSVPSPEIGQTVRYLGRSTSCRREGDGNIRDDLFDSQEVEII